MARRAVVIGSSAGAAQAALTLAELGVPVSVVTPSPSIGLDSALDNTSLTAPDKRLSVWPLLLRAASHPLTTIYTNCEVNDVTGKRGRLTVKVTRSPRFVNTNLCTGCSRCAEACSVQVPCILDGRRATRSAIHPPSPDNRSVPVAFCIDKIGVAPCRAACPLGINVQGFVSLISMGRTDEALELITDVAPLAGVLGRVCTHPCQDACKRAEIDAPVFIPALHRFAVDEAPGGIKYKRKAPPRSRREKIAIVGSGPAGLSAAWELARRGYSPTIFESHAVVGGMVATGIPRFRLPLEVREREVEAIKDLGVDIKTGVTVGRDVTISDLRERGYKAFFIAVGAHENRRLNIPGENLEGVVDAVSLLFALNLKVGVSVGSNIVVIGGGNSAVDSARTAKRRSKGEVRILYRRTAEEMTAVADEVAEAINEGVSIEYLTQPVEILGEGGRVTGIRCQRMKLGDVDADGRRRPEPIPGSEYDLKADHVVMAIGQRPNSAVLNIPGLDIDSDEAVIRADPLTLETSVQGVFAGGDCVTGPNNVVEAVAAGLRAAVSIDRFLRGRNIRKGRDLEKPTPVDVDVRERETSYIKRARMPSIPPHKRMGKFEEIALGLPPDVGQREAQRCLNCALCSECLQCERVCEVGAVVHKDKAEEVEVGAAVVIDFAGAVPADSTPGIFRMAANDGCTLEDELALASAVALEVAAGLRPSEESQPARYGAAPGTESPRETRPDTTPETSAPERIGVVLCRCSGSISSMVDFNTVTNEMLQRPGVCCVQEISQACSEEGAARIATDAAEWNLDKVVIAACRCCGLDQVCFSCTDRRVACQQNFSGSLDRLHDKRVEFANIREHCAWVHTDDPAGATRKAIEIVAASVARAAQAAASSGEEQPVAGGALIIGAGSSGLAAAKNLASLGFPVTIVSGPGSALSEGAATSAYGQHRADLLAQLQSRGTNIAPWPERIDLRGSPGCYEADLGGESQPRRVQAGVVVLDIGNREGQVPADADVISRGSLLGRILSRMSSAGDGDSGYPGDLREVAIRETAGVFVVAADPDEPPEEHALKGAAAAARASVYLSRTSLQPRGAAVTVNSKLCRGCGTCASICSYVEMRARSSGVACAHVDRALCLGCGACVAHCPTGAIGQPAQSDRQLGSVLEALLGKVPA